MSGVNIDNNAKRRHLLIDATISAIAEFGLSKLTLAKISSIAGLTAGTVNFYFDSKETLLLETLNFVSEEFDQGIAAALKTAGPEPSSKLAAIIDASLDPEVTEHRKMAVWHAFDSESRGREDYQRIRGNLDKQNFNLILGLCEQIIKDANKQAEINARAIANAIAGITDEVWKEILFAGENYDREDARVVCLSFLASIFPWCFSMPSKVDSTQSDQPSTVSIVKASMGEIEQVAVLFDQYRQFYKQEADINLAKNYILNRVSTETSTIFLAKVNDKAVGFTQLYSSFCSVDASPIIILYDLFVDSEVRQSGVGKALMDRAKEHAKEIGASRLDLETENTNIKAQRLYESLGYERETYFYKYSLEI